MNPPRAGPMGLSDDDDDAVRGPRPPPPTPPQAPPPAAPRPKSAASGIRIGEASHPGPSSSSSSSSSSDSPSRRAAATVTATPPGGPGPATPMRAFRNGFTPGPLPEGDLQFPIRNLETDSYIQKAASPLHAALLAKGLIHTVRMA